jgi:acetyl-CoA C-acetyltransferase
MRDVAIIGIGHTKFGRAEKTSLELFSEATLQAVDDAGVDLKDLEALFQGAALSGFEEGQLMPAAFSTAELNLGTIPSTRFEGACASATVAIRDAAMWVGAGTFAMACHAPTEGPAGLTFPGVFAMAARSYARNYDIPLETLREKMAYVSIKNHKHGALNPLAQFYKKMGDLKVEDVVNSRMVADPITLMDCCPFSDGASALVLCPAEDARKYTDEPVYILGTGQGSGSSLSKMADITKPVSRITSAKMAFKRAGLSPKDIDMVEVHDCFTIAELIALECMGFFEWGEAAAATADGQTDLGGELPVNMSGGLIGKGHPIGATGASQVYWVAKQMRGEAPKGNQIDPVPEYGMTDTLGGDFGTLCHIILGRTKRAN